MSTRETARPPREILRDLRTIGNMIVDGDVSESIFQRADSVLWEAFENNLFGGDRAAKLAATECRKWSEENDDPHHRGFAEAILERWYTAKVGRSFEQVLRSFDLPWPRGLGAMLREVPLMLTKPLNHTQQMMADYIRAHHGCTYDEIGAAIKKSPTTLRSAPNSRALKAHGFELRDGFGWFETA